MIRKQITRIRDLTIKLTRNRALLRTLKSLKQI